MPSSRTNDRKVSLSFTNWVLGGSLVSITSTESDTHRRRSSGRKVVIAEVESDDNGIVVEKKTKKDDKTEKNGEKRDGGKVDEDKSKEGDHGKRKDDEGDKKDKPEEKMCKTCGKDCAEEGTNKDDGDIAKKNDGDGDKKSEEKKSDELKDKAGHRGGASSSGWTSQQDSKLKEMKAAQKSWKEIALEVGASKSDCQKRFKELQAAGDEKPSGDSGDKDEENKAVDSGETTEGSSWDNGGGDGEDLAFEDLFVDNNEGSGWANEPAQRSETSNNNSDSNTRSKKQNKGSNSNHSQGIDGEWNNGGGNNQNQNNAGWTYNSNYQAHRGSQGRLQANDIWSKDDCEILEMLEVRYREHKWLHIQAGFFNWTGRMITADLIERKFRDDGVEDGRDYGRW